MVEGAKQKIAKDLFSTVTFLIIIYKIGNCLRYFIISLLSYGLFMFTVSEFSMSFVKFSEF